MLFLSVKVGETLHIGNARIRVLKKSGQLASLQIDVGRDVPIYLEKIDAPSPAGTYPARAL